MLVIRLYSTGIIIAQSIFFLKEKENLVISFGLLFLHSQNKEGIVSRANGSVVQLVRMPPCHGGGRGFESRPVRKKSITFKWCFLRL